MMKKLLPILAGLFILVIAVVSLWFSNPLGLSSSPQSTIKSTAKVKALLDRQKRFYEKCLIKAYEDSEGTLTSGELKVELTISASGHLIQMKVLNSTIGNANLHSCLKQVFERVRFPQLPRQESFTYPILVQFPTP